MKKIFCCLLIFFTYCAIAQNVSPNFGWPVNTVNELNNRGKITGTPSEYRSPYTGGSAVIFGVTISGHRYHQGIDIANSHGQNVYSIEDNNSIVEIEGSSSSGNRRIRIGNTVYWHVDENPILFDGATVDKNDIIGTTNAGSLAPHLHIQPSPSTIFGSANFLTYKFNNYQDCSIPNFDSNSSGELIIEFYENGHSKIDGLSNEMNQQINGSNLIFGNIDLVVGVNDEPTLPDCNGANDGGNLGINKIQFKIKSENEIYHENNQIDFSNLPNYESAGHINGHYSSSSNHRYVVTNDPFNMPYDKYLNTRKKNNSGDIFNPDDLSQYALFNLESIITDNIYNLEITVSDVDSDSENENFNSSSILIDNFLPYIKKVTLSDSEGVFYEGEWTLNSSETALEFNQCTIRNNIETGFNVQIETSETLDNLSMNLAGVSDNLISTNTEKTVWELQNPFNGSVTSNQTISFNGTDTAGNLLLIDPSNLYYRVSDTTWDSYTPTSPTAPATGTDTIHIINMSVNCSDSCNDNFEPNNTQSQAFLLSSVGKDFSSYANLDACLSYDNIYEDWYLIGATAQGELNITLANQTDDFEIELYSEGASTPFDQGVLQSNGNVTLGWCSPSNSCVPIYIKVYKEQFSTPPSNPNYNYSLILDWNFNQNCNTSGKQTNNNSNQNSNLTITGNTNICVGGSTNLTASGGSGNYQWFLNGSEIGTGNPVTVSNLNTGNNKINVVDLNSACNSGSIDIIVTQGITANAGTNITIQNGGSTTLQGSGGTSCSWSPTTGLSNPNSCNPTASPTQTTTYTLTVTEDGCTDTDQVTITVNGSGGNEPDNDNCNDAINLTSNTNCNYTFGTIDHATADGFPNNPSCDAQTNPNAFGVFYSFIAVNNTHTVTVNPTGALDAVLAVYSGNNCFGLSEFDCDDSSGVGSATITNNNFVIGQEYWIRVYDYGTSEPAIGQGGFNICVTHQENNADGIDLVSNITGVSDNNPDAGDTITIDYTASNIGDEDTTTLPTISFYLSSNTTLSGSDDFLNTEAILQTIDANETINGDIEVNLPNVLDGQYYLFSAIDNIYLIDESNENNNLDFFSIQIGDVAQNGPDLDVRRVRAVPDTDLVPGQEVELEIRIENEGTEDVNDFEVLVFLDIDDDGNPDSNELMGTFTFNGLDVDEDETVIEDFDLPTYILSAGTYDLIAIADSDNQINEPNENNNDDNDRVTIALASTYTDDITILNESVIETNVNAGGTINVAANHIYLGSNTSSDLPTLRLGYYLSTDCNFSYAEDVYLGDDTSNLGINNPNIDEDSVLTIPLATPSGTYYILFVADGENLIDEGVLENNNVACVEITVNGTSTPEGDIFITDEVCNPYIVAIGSEVEVYTNINYSGNQLNADIPSIDVFYFLSTDCVLSNDDILVSDDSVSLGSDIPVNDVTEAIELPSNLNPGTYFILIRADVENGVYETNENNNIACVEFSLFTANSNYQDVTLSYPNVDVTEANLGDQVYISVFQNYTGYQIDADLSSVRVHYYLSTDCILDSEDYYLEDDPSGIGSDDPSELETQTVTIPSDISSGQYYILFVADATDIVTENNENNNLECVPITINDSTLSLEEYELSNQIKIYPNPVHDILTLNLGSTFSEITVDVFNLVGQKINSYTFKNKQVLKISTSQFSNGMYFLNIKTNFGITKPFKIIKK